MKNILLIGVLALCLIVFGCASETGSTQQISIDPEEPLVAKVNGQPISVKALEFITAEAQQRNRNAKVPKETLIEELVNRELLYQDALAKELNKDPEVVLRLNILTRSVYSQAAIQEFVEKTEVTEAELKQEYDSRVGQMIKTEYKARHILTKSEEAAKDLINKLNEGENFEELAKKHSTDSTAGKGGDLGWFSPQLMVPPFSKAVIALQNGAHTAEPVKTRFGWHVILREDSRDKQAPSLESSKDSIKTLVQRQKLKQHIDGLRDTADIVIIETGTAETGADKSKVSASGVTDKNKTDKSPGENKVKVITQD